MSWRNALKLDDAIDLVVLRCAWVERETQEELSSYAAEGPHINGSIIRQAKKNLKTNHGGLVSRGGKDEQQIVL
jgi:hypothetical protein